MNFASDNTAPVAPAILDAIVQANTGYAMGYGNDDWTNGVERQLSELFERDVAVFLVPTGTAANALSLAQVTPPWGVVFCHQDAHIVTDECGAPEFFGDGLKLDGLPGDGAKITPETLKSALACYGGHEPHQMVASTLSITQASEAGTIYRTDEIAELCEIAHTRNLAVHMDGARFANALVRLNTTPAQMTWRSGIDVLSFGATKGGALAAEAVVVFDPARASFLGERRKRAGHLLSKHRFIAAQMAAYLAEGRWLALARHARVAFVPQGDQAGAQLAYYKVMVPACQHVMKSGPDKYHGRCVALLRHATTAAVADAAEILPPPDDFACNDDRDDSNDPTAQVTACSD